MLYRITCLPLVHLYLEGEVFGLRLGTRTVHEERPLMGVFRPWIT